MSYQEDNKKVAEINDVQEMDYFKMKNCEAAVKLVLLRQICNI